MPTRSTSKTPTAKPASGKASTSRPKRKSTVKPSPVPPPTHKYLSGNAWVCGDNLDILKDLPDGCVDLIYLDPPFNSNHNYVAAFGDKGRVDAQLRDIWRWTVETENAYQRLPHGSLLNAVNAVRLVSGDTSPMAAYSIFMGRRLAELHRVLKPTGSIYLHCDPNANWCLRILLDSVFDSHNFRSEIIWRRTNAKGLAFKGYPNNFDTLFYYAKSDGFAWNRPFIPHGPGYVEKFYRHVEPGTGRRYRLSDLTNPNRDRPNLTYEWNGHHRVWRWTKGRMQQAHDEGLIHYAASGLASQKRYLDEMKGNAVDTIWDDIQPIQAQSPERVGYPTQKPLTLLERIINASSEKGSLVLDPFCGCGTAADAAAKLGRKYLGIDVSAIAVRVMEQRLTSRGGAAMPVVYRMDWDDYEWEQFERRALMNEADAEDGLPGWAWAEDKVAGLLNALPNEKKVGDGGVDARYFTERGEIIPIQVKMYQGQIGRPQLQNLLGVQAEWQNRKVKAPMSLMVTLYPPRENLRVFARQQGDVTLRGERYPKMQVLSVQEMLTKQARPKLPPVDPRYLVGDTQTRFAMAE